LIFLKFLSALAIGFSLLLANQAVLAQNCGDAVAYLASEVYAPKPFSEIERVLQYIRPFGSAAGEFNAGIYIVRLKTGEEVALKLVKSSAFTSDTSYFSLEHRALNDYLQIHFRLGQQGVAPKLKGILKPFFASEWEHIDLANRLGMKKPPDTSSNVKVIGILMEIVPGAWDLRKSDEIPKFMRHWTADQLREAAKVILEIEKNLHSQGISPEDLTFFFDEAGKSWIGDLDLFRTRKMEEESRKENRRILIQRLSDAYSRATGIRVNLQPFLVD